MAWDKGKKKTIVLLFVILIAWLPLFMGAWDKGEPVEGILAPDLNDVIRANNDALEAALDAWMRFATGGTQTGQPRQGSARVYFQDSVPTARLDGEYFDSADLGCLWIDSNTDPDNQFNFLSAADGAGTETWTPISTEIIAVLLASARVFLGTLGVTGNFAVNTDKFTVAADSGNTAIAGTLGVTGISTLAKASLLASSDAPTADAMIANKKYVDDHVGSANYTPTSYASEESITFPNGLVMKTGYKARSGADTTITFAAAFGTAIVSVTFSPVNNDDVALAPTVHTVGVTSFKIHSDEAAIDGYYWTAIGY